MTRPFQGASDEAWCWKKYAPLYLEVTREVGRTRHVPVIDLYAMFEKQPDYFEDECHFTEAGHRLAATKIYDEIQGLLPH